MTCRTVREIPMEPASLLVVYCHHGARLSAATYLDRIGYHNVRSLAGGIDAGRAKSIQP